MEAVLFLLSVWISLSSGNTVTPVYKGCFSTSFVEQYASYYKFKQSLTLEQSIAACNSRLTRYMALEMDKDSPVYNHVFCGNDLAEVSPNLNFFQCHICEDNRSFFCGKNGSMSVYLLRDSTPLSLLLATNNGVELLSDNKTTLKVNHSSSSIYKFLDYMYTEDMIVSGIDTSLFRSFYNPLAMRFSPHYKIKDYPPFSVAVDFVGQHLYYCYRPSKKMYEGKVLGTYSESELFIGGTNYQEQISTDPYNRSLVFLENPYNSIYLAFWDRSLYEIKLTEQHVEKINALSMDIHEMLLYAILTFYGDSTTYLVSLDYGVSQMRIVCSAPQLENAKLLEVFRNDAVWISNTSGMSTVFQCKLMPKCRLETLIALPFNETIHDFTIYHPEKQTPGKKRLCANMTCSHGCQLFSPFTAICTCPPGMDLKPDQSTCFWGPTLAGTVRTTSIPSPHESTWSPVDSTTPIYGLNSTSQFTTHRSDNQSPGNTSLYAKMNCSQTQICQNSSVLTCRCTCPRGMKLDSDNFSCVWLNQTTTTSEAHDKSSYPVGSTRDDVFTLAPEVMIPTSNDKSALVYHRNIFLLIGFCILIILITFSVVVFDLYRKNNRLLKLQQRHTNIIEMHLKSIENHYTM